MTSIDHMTSPAALSSTESTECSARRSGRGLLPTLRRLILRDPVALAAIVALVVVSVGALAAPTLDLPDPLALDPGQRLVDPGAPGHPLGTDELGRDILSRLAWGARTSLLIPVMPILGAVLIGAALGVIGGYFGRWIDGLIMRAMDVLLAFPSILLAIGIAAALGPGLNNALIAIGVVEVPTFARLVRSTALSTRHLEYVQAARCLGATDGAIIWRHVLPSTFSPVLVYGTLGYGRVIILAASLSFLGLGVQPPVPDWGAMLDAGRKVMLLAPHVATIPGLAIFAVSLAINVLGDVLRDALDPRLSTSSGE